MINSTWDVFKKVHDARKTIYEKRRLNIKFPALSFVGEEGCVLIPRQVFFFADQALLWHCQMLSTSPGGESAPATLLIPCIVLQIT